MYTHKLNPFFTRKPISGVLDDIFNRSIADIVGGDFSISQPSANIYEQDDMFKLDVAAPGLTREDFNITVENDQLVVSASKDATKTDENEGTWTKKEFNYTSFKRAFHLSETIDVDNINATYTDGILSISLPKKEAAKAKTPKTVEIK